LIKQKLDCALQLTRTVALDFNNALTSILGHASLILSKMEGSHPWRNSMMEVEKAAGRAAEIAFQLAAFSRQDKEPSGLSSGNLNVLVRRVAEIFQQTRDVEIAWSVQLENRLYSVRFDEAKIQQALVKIVENAVQAIKNRGHISVTSRNIDITEPTQDRTAQLVPGSYVTVEVTDDGSGIAPDVMPRVFEPFFTTKHNRRGLGLAWVYGIITNHGGGVAVSSEPGRGTSVRIYLPATQKIIREGGEPLPQSGSQRTILMVDDEDLLLTMGQTILSSFGYRVLTANNGQQALELMAKAAPPVNLVIADLVMPQMSGRELIDQIQSRFPEVPVICASGYVRPGSPEQDEYFLQKPFTSHDLIRRVQSVLDQTEGE
jgi:CheY-like chemotaxis protein